MRQRKEEIDKLLLILREHHSEELQTRLDQYRAGKDKKGNIKQGTPTPNHALPATAAIAAAQSTRWSFSRGMEWFIEPLLDHDIVNGCVPLKKLPRLPTVEKAKQSLQSDNQAVTDRLERAHRARYLTKKLQDELHSLNELHKIKGRGACPRDQRARSLRKDKQEIMKRIQRISQDMAAVKVFRPLSKHERINPSLYVTPMMLGHEESVVLDVFVCDLYDTEEERAAHRDLVCRLFPELQDQSFLAIDVGTVVPVAGFDILNGRLIKVGESISHRLLKSYDRPVARRQSIKSKMEQQLRELHGKPNPGAANEAEKLTRDIDQIDEEINDLYQRRRNVASRVHQSILDVIQVYDCILMPHLKQWRRWPSAARKQASAIRLQEWQSKVKDLCAQRNILLISDYPEHWTTATCLCCQAVNNPQGRRVYKCSNKSCVKHIERLVTLRDPESSIKLSLSLLWRLLQSRKQGSAASAAKDE